MSLKSHFLFNKQQQSGILLLLTVLLILLGVYFFYDFEEEPVIDLTATEVVALQNKMDSLKLAAAEAKKPVIYPFNPNYLTDFKAYTLGMSPSEFDRLKAYRNNNQWINSAEDFKKVTQVSDSLLTIISPYFKFPEWVTNRKTTSKINQFQHSSVKKKSTAQKADLNTATALELQKVYGVGEALSKRIVAFREKHKGFADDAQLHSVYGLSEEVIKRIQEDFTVKTPRAISKMNLNTASASDIATIPGISFDLAKKIWEFRKVRERVTHMQELEKIEGITPQKIQLIQLYLYID